MLTNKERAKLRSFASKTKSIFNLGKDGISHNLLKQIDNYLIAHELIKISVLQNASKSEKDFAIEIAYKLNAEIVETKGSTLVLYKKSLNKKGEHLL